MAKYRNYLFWILLIALYLYLDYQHILFLRPQGVHFIRQTDGLSFVANYFRNGFDFFHPQVFNLQSTNGRAACEFPIIYYLTAVSYLLFHEHEFLLRLFTLVIASVGFSYLFKMLFLLLEDVMYALVFTFLFISSGVLLYYSNNFLPDASALGITLTGWYFFFKYSTGEKRAGTAVIFFCCFMLASLIRVTYMVNPIAAFISLVVHDLLQRKNLWLALRLNLLPVVLFALTVLAVLAWNLYVISYNRINHDTYFLIRARPIWSIVQSEIAVVWNHITNYWYYSYYYHRTFQFYFLVTIAGLVYLKRVNKVVIVPVVFLFSGSACYFLLFFVQFRDHDYYFITLMPAIILVVTNSFICLKSKYPGIINSSVAKIVIAALCLLSLRFAHERVAERYANASDNFAGIGTKMASVRQYFDASGVPEDAKIVIITDQSPNGGLYFLNRPGWNLWDTSALCKFLLKKHIREGADYILFTEKEYLDLKVDGWKIGEVNGVTIFKVKTRS